VERDGPQHRDLHPVLPGGPHQQEVGCGVRGQRRQQPQPEQERRQQEEEPGEAAGEGWAEAPAARRAPGQGQAGQHQGGEAEAGQQAAGGEEGGRGEDGVSVGVAGQLDQQAHGAQHQQQAGVHTAGLGPAGKGTGRVHEMARQSQEMGVSSAI
jgi:hypothetical protein